MATREKRAAAKRLLLSLSTERHHMQKAIALIAQKVKIDREIKQQRLPAATIAVIEEWMMLRQLLADARLNYPNASVAELAHNLGIMKRLRSVHREAYDLGISTELRRKFFLSNPG